MAFLAEGVVSFGIEKLWDLLSRESERLQGIDEQVDELKRQLRRLQSLLKDADAKKHSKERVRGFLEDVKDLVYDAEDIIESFLLKSLRRKEKGIKKQARRLACFLTDRHKVASDIAGITKKISKVIDQEMQSLGIKEIFDGGPSRSFQERQIKQKEILQTFPNSYESDLVGVEQSVEELVGHLVENDNIQVVSISGMGGIGKTTLARQVFHHETVRRHFDGFAWVCVSQQFTQKHVWQRILQQLLPNDGEMDKNTIQGKLFRPQDGEILQMDECALQGKLFQLLETTRYLVILDDVWKKEDWDRIKAVFPRKRGWKMMLTSRNEGVGLHTDPTCFSFRPRILNPEESWRLCERIVFPRSDETEEMVAIGKEMVTYCGGLPLAIEVLGGLLVNKHTVREWKRVSKDIGAQILVDDNLGSVNRILSLSYEDLPTHLKHCFLYLAHFPEDYMIFTESLFNYWAAEGILKSFYDGSTIRDSGEDYLEELVRRNMVIAEKTYLRPRSGYCQMHDMMRELCLSKAKEENFLQIIKVPTSTSTINAQFRRLSIHAGNALYPLGHKKNKKVRSLSVSGVQEDFWIQSASVFQNLPLLRVLDLSRVNFQGGKLPSSIGGLIHLRFLSLYDAKVFHLPSSMRYLKRLLFLDLRVLSEVHVHVPNVLKEMLELRYLSLPFRMHDKTKLELGDLVNLDNMRGFSMQQISLTDLVRMTKLRSLSVYLSKRCTFETLSSSLRLLRNLELLHIICLYESPMLDYEGEFVQYFIHLKELFLSVRMTKIPDQHQFPPRLAHIELFYCHMEEDPMPILEKMLHLKSVELGFEAFVGRKIVCSNGGFPQLCALEISRQFELEEWIVEKGSMPCLRTLTIHNCKKLKELPDGLKYITSLKELKIEGMKREWKEKLVPGGEDYYKVQNIPDVQFINCDEE